MDSIIYVNSNYDSMSDLEKEKNENRDFLDIESQIQKGRTSKNSKKEELSYESH